MANLSLDNCGNCASLPPLGQLPSLKKLYIKGMSVLKRVGCEFYGQGGIQPFPLLQTLSFENMPEWEDWYTFGDHKEVQPFTRVNMADDEVISANAKSKHPSLITSLSIWMIKKLELLPKWVTHGLMELKALKITSCEELKTLWKNEKGLDVLSMEWSVNSDDSRDGRVETEVLDMLQPHKNLKELHIKGYLGTGFSTWIGDPLFSNMAGLHLDNCGNCAFLPPLGQLPSLKKLYIKGMSVLKHVGCEFYGQGDVQPFPLLETLSFENMLEWEDWYTFGDRKEVQPFTRVKYLSIIECPKLLKMLPTDLPCLNNLKIRDCPKLCWMMPKDLRCLNDLEISQFLVKGSSNSLLSLTSIAMNDVPLTSLKAVLEMRSMADDEVISANAKSTHPNSMISLSIGMIKKLELLPKWVTHGLMELEALKITSCEELKTLWKNEARVQHSLPAFRRLEIEGCPQLVSLFEGDEDEENEGQHQQQQEEGLPCIARLEHLRIYNCEKLEKLPQLLHTFTFLQELYVYNCPSLGSFPETGFPCTLKTLRIISHGNANPVRPNKHGLKVRYCEARQSLFEWITQINDNNLEVLTVENCPSLTCLISCRGWFHSATNLRELNIRGCKKLNALPHGSQSMNINCLTSLQELYLNISEWNNFKKIDLHSLSSLKILLIEGKDEEHPVGSSFPIDGMLLPTSLIDLRISDGSQSSCCCRIEVYCLSVAASELLLDVEANAAAGVCCCWLLLVDKQLVDKPSIWFIVDATADVAILGAGGAGSLTNLWV
ncbi:hypothetical protein TEA_018603 [Camellia sinensis var. sinensis]|uniref:NB-ARC domain-containing protein n=1 Tax=Camellia sinensis var. sinensis TaxID=542762 RepID=A0A4S4DFP1_CAMSN|nr:hypothetical protein TEA_018603 [Camellia sinensis var. sinensis]